MRIVILIQNRCTVFHSSLFTYRGKKCQELNVEKEFLKSILNNFFIDLESKVHILFREKWMESANFPAQGGKNEIFV